MSDGRKAESHSEQNTERASRAEPAIRLDRAALLGSGDRVSAAKIGDKGGGGGGGMARKDT